MIYRGEKPKTPSLEITESGDFQPWQFAPYVDAAELGVELIFNHPTITIKDKCEPPFVSLSKDYYQLTTDTVLSTQRGLQVLVMPHWRYYAKLDFPMPLPCAWHGWWAKPIEVLFRFGQEVTFTQGEPFAQAVVVQPTVCRRMDAKEEKQNDIAREYLEKNVDKYVTRGNNLYNVLANLDKLPPELNPYKPKLRLFNAKVVQN